MLEATNAALKKEGNIDNAISDGVDAGLNPLISQYNINEEQLKDQLKTDLQKLFDPIKSAWIKVNSG